MAIRITCPSCDASYSVDDSKRGKKIRCRKCEERMLVTAGNKRGDAEAVQERRKVKAKASARSRADDDDDDDASLRRPMSFQPRTCSN